MTLRRTYIDSATFGQLHVRIAAPSETTSKPPLYCLHQSPKSSLEFETFMKAASADRVCVAPDYPGYGMSDKPTEKPSIADYAAACWVVASALGHERIDVFGNHTGAKVAAEMAVQNEAGIRAIAMVSAALLNEGERAHFSGYFQPIPLDMEGTRFTTTWKRITQHASKGMTLEAMSKSFLQSVMGGEEYEWGHEAAFAWHEPFINALKSLPHPIIILNPGDELAECTRRAETLMRKGQIIELPDWGHGFLEYAAQDAADLVRGRLDATA